MEANSVNVLASYFDHEVVRDDLPISFDRLERVPKRCIDASSCEGPPANLPIVELHSSALGADDLAHGIAVLGEYRPCRIVEVRIALIAQEHRQNALADFEAEKLREESSPGGLTSAVRGFDY